MDIAHYMNLPDGMEAADVASEFEFLLAEAERPGVLCVPVVEALWQLADRQWHTYELLRPDLLSRVEGWLRQHWSSDPEFIRWVGGIAGQLGLPGVLPLLEGTAREFSETQFGREISQTLREITPHIDDPYWSMRTQK
jgi:hypothetical protein